MDSLLLDLRSLWMSGGLASWWRYSMPLAICLLQFKIMSTGRERFLSWTTLERGPPLAYSITRHITQKCSSRVETTLIPILPLLLRPEKFAHLAHKNMCALVGNSPEQTDSSKMEKYDLPSERCLSSYGVCQGWCQGWSPL